MRKELDVKDEMMGVRSRPPTGVATTYRDWRRLAELLNFDESVGAHGGRLGGGQPCGPVRLTAEMNSVSH